MDGVLRDEILTEKGILRFLSISL